MREIGAILSTSPVIPVLIIEDAAHAFEIAQALVDGGLRVLEVTLRTPAAANAIAEMRKVSGAIVGAGTVLNEAQLETALNAGAEFVVSPGLSPNLVRAAAAHGIPILPGVATASEIMRGLDLGLKYFKFFPAIANGGIEGLKALIGPFGDVGFCPTGGITLQNAPDWLTIPQVLCVGGTWLVPKGQPDPNLIRAAAAEASALRP